MKKTEKTYSTRKELGHIMALIQSLNVGDSFYTSAGAKVVTRYAALYSRSVKTERVITVHSYKSELPEAGKLTKVTIL